MAGKVFELTNLEKVQARLLAIPKAAREALSRQLKTEVDDLVEAMKRAAPVDELSKDPGNFRDSIHAYPNPDREISYRILADAKDEQGRFVGAHIEHGHRSPGGGHVPAKPSFFPTYRARKKQMRRRLSKAARDAIRAEFSR